MYLSSCLHEPVYLECCQCHMFAFAEYEVLLYSARQRKLVFISHIHAAQEEPAVCLTCVVYQGTPFFILLLFFSFLYKWTNLERCPLKTLKKSLSGMKSYMGLSQIHSLQLDSCAMDSLFKEDIYIKANPKMKKISQACLIHFLNGEFDEDKGE